MRFRVSILPRAQQDIEETYAFIAEVQHQPLIAARWLEGVEALIESLTTLANRGSMAREQELLGSDPPIRQVLFHNHRILYTITNDHVEVIHVRRGTMSHLTRGDL